MASRHGLPSQDPGAPLVVHTHLAVDDNVGYARGEPARVVVGGVVYDALGIEHDEVAIVSLLDPPPAGQTEPASRVFSDGM